MIQNLIFNRKKRKINVQELVIMPTKNTPAIELNPEGTIYIGGRSMIADVDEFGKQINGWIDNYISDPADLTCVDFHLEYLSANNRKFYIHLLNKIDCLKLKNKKFIIKWYYDEGDEDIYEKGEYISSVLNTNFNFIKVSESKIT
jgi:hypothetical protein